MLSLNNELIVEVVNIAKEAGERIMEVYNTDTFKVETKHDEHGFDSPLTEADTAAHSAITKGLSKLTPNTHVVSEEDESSHTKASDVDEFWIVDPLDGTKEFIKRGNDFTVNIGLIRNGVPVAGVIFVPVKNVSYWGWGDQAWKQIGNNEPVKIKVSTSTTVKRAVASKSHFDETTAEFLKQFGDIDFVQAGSSLKICLVAEGEAEIYPRFAPTMEWDTGAGDAILRAAGGKMLDLKGNAFKYLKPELRNPGFICTAPNVKFKLEGSE